MDFIVVLAKVYPKEGCKDTIIDLADDLIENTLAEEGNIDYQLLKSINDNILEFIPYISLPCQPAYQSPAATQGHRHLDGALQRECLLYPQPTLPQGLRKERQYERLGRFHSLYII